MSEDLLCSQVLLPALRADMATLPLPQIPVGPAAKPYLTCCVRLSPEKEPNRYVIATWLANSMPSFSAQ